MVETDPMPYELRTYTTIPGRMDALLARFRDHTVALFEKHGMHSVGYWLSDADPNVLIYLLNHDGDPKQNWVAFQSDADWIAAKAASVIDGEIVDHLESLFLSPTDFSALA